MKTEDSSSFNFSNITLEEENPPGVKSKLYYLIGLIFLVYCGVQFAA